MTAISSGALIGLGEVGQILAADLAAAGLSGITAFDLLFADPNSAPSRAPPACRPCAAAAAAVRGRELVLSAVTAGACLDAARDAAAAIAPGAFFLDLNSV